MSPVEAEGPPTSQGIPKVPVNFVPATEGEIIALGHMSLRILEDGSRTGLFPYFWLFSLPRISTRHD